MTRKKSQLPCKARTISLSRISQNILMIHCEIL